MAKGPLLTDNPRQVLTHRARSLLLVIDMQEKLGPKIDGIDEVLMRNRVLLDMAGQLDVPVVFTEQYPKGLGGTYPDLLTRAPGGKVVEKIHFDATAADTLLPVIEAQGRSQIIVTGTEAHVCVLQTAMSLLRHGLDVRLVTDAVGSRRPADRDAGIARLCDAGAIGMTTEMVIFEWLEQADTEAFRRALPTIRDLVR
ncbi:MAG: hydrolase [Alphaproteobacteria bacterium]|nr:hydrolase [Alphaproteobacteria bacterium]